MRLFVTRNLVKSFLKNSKMKMPTDVFNYEPTKYPHFHLFLEMYEFEFLEVETLYDMANMLATVSDEEILIGSDYVYLTEDALIEMNRLGLIYDIKANWRRIAKSSIKKSSNVGNIQDTRQPNNFRVRGVKWVEKKKKWKAEIQYQGTKYTLGYFDDFNDALKERQKAEKEYFHWNV